MGLDKKNQYFYSLRYAMEPGRHEQAHFDRLLAFCMSARIDDVMFFINGEELNQGHLTREETKPWMEMIARGMALLEPLGITTSINPWPTLLHGDRGRTLREGQGFTLMTDPYGNATTAVACPLCPEWRRYITDIYACYAELHPEILWVEDDFRLHNHRPLIWGGCFCDRHMEEYSRRAGRKLSREEFVEGVLRPGEPHPFRKIWLDTARDAMVENAAVIGRAVHEVSPDTRIGLMSSCPHVHCAEGRDWKGILSGLAAGNAMVSRPTLPAYIEVTPQDYMQNLVSYSALTVSMIPRSTLVYPELENFPHSRFSKSRAFTGFQLKTSLALGADGITLNLFDMMGNGILRQEGYQKTLAETKDLLSSIKALGLKEDRRRGIRVLASPESSYTLYTAEGSSMEELYPRETFWARLLSVMGVTNAYCIDGIPTGEVAAVSGQYFRNLDEFRLRDLFENNYVIMDGEAAYTLYDMGLGGLAGINGAAWHPMESGFQAYEQACNGRSYALVEEARVSAQTCVGDYLEIDWESGVSLLSQAMNAGGQAVGPGMAVYDNRVLVLPYGKFDSIQGHLTPIRQSMIQSTIDNIGSKYHKPAYVISEPNILLCQYQLDYASVLLLVNCSLDDTGELKIHMSSGQYHDILELGSCDAVLVPSKARMDGASIILKEGLGALAVKVLLFSETHKPEE